ncbi:glucosyltransferase Alg8 [Schizosaccharomyces cryophilus OY26]|uniref:Alpha-1,3-glucosyltransferase n=1 Tax=Schizosaccharomyces cryophilus (strain OY26 / ATCC MYA-4695 / CBS 11777 / NBRC 106824 / NRRL Y48691) TaxID=653667 RepID=S9W0G5_SCHCR|nr:glucosyltransferase Alg8 [Schizosaccharomyces cryophilus OY26]EPY51899.1 glucosyltransferase Alg8 [Schizosaccharomyces cryophilus OY26]
MAGLSMLYNAAIASTFMKILLFPCYRSTDFEVHRNWLAITHSLPISQWYTSAISEWTLDYPPFFAYFEFVLSWIAKLLGFDTEMLNPYNLNYASPSVIIFQRSSVIISELVLLWALREYVYSYPENSRGNAVLTAIDTFLSPGFVLIDHIHFQYNGFLFGLLIWSLILTKQNRLLMSAAVFTTLLCFKHIFLYIAPAYFIYLLRVYCFSISGFRPQVLNTMKLGLTVSSIFLLAFGPWIYMGQTPQVFSRLFPFSRGLCHAYWAPNFWALYSFFDRIAYAFLPRLGYSFPEVPFTNAPTRGLVGDTTFAVLPNISPSFTFYLCLALQSCVLLKLFFRPTWRVFVGATTLCGWISFLFGWHVHEKAIMIVIIPFSILSLIDRRYLEAFRPLAVAGYISLLPLIFTPQEAPIKYLFTGAWVAVLLTFDKCAPVPLRRVFLLNRVNLAYVAGFVPLFIYNIFFHNLVFGGRYEFLPLMLLSTYSAWGVFWAFISLSWLYFTDLK